MTFMTVSIVDPSIGPEPFSVSEPAPCREYASVEDAQRQLMARARATGNQLKRRTVPGGLQGLYAVDRDWIETVTFEERP